MATLNFNADQVTLTSLMNTERPSDTLSRNMIFKILSDTSLFAISSHGKTGKGIEKGGWFSKANTRSRSIIMCCGV